MNNKLHALQTGTFYKVKNPKREFLCALCSAPRQLKYSKNLSFMNFFQILLISAAITTFLFPIIGAKSIFSVVVVWPIFEGVNKLLYRKDIICPYCGFDATWYRRDVKVANQKVQDFWKQNYPELLAKNNAMKSNEAVEITSETEAAS